MGSNSSMPGGGDLRGAGMFGRHSRNDGPGDDDDDLESDSYVDYDDSSSASDAEVRNAEDLISVFQVLIRNGQIHVMSSAEDSEDDATYTTNRNVRAPRIIYEPDMEQIQKNDIALRMRTSLGLDSSIQKSLPQLLSARELGNIPGACGFDTPHRNLISSGFLPNTVRKIANYGVKAFCGSYSKDGDIFLSASQDRAIRIYDTSKDEFKEFKKILGRDVGWSVLDTAFSPDGRQIVYSSWSESIHLCNIYGDSDTHESLCLCPDTRRFCIFSLVFSDDGHEILGGANDGYLYLYNRECNQRVLKIEAHDDDVNSVAFADETSHILFSAADDGLSKVWDRRTLSEANPKPVGILAGHLDGITYIDSKRDGRYFVTNSKDQSIKLWDMRVFASEETISSAKRTVTDQNWDYRWQRVPKKLCIPRKPADGDTSVMTYRGHSVLNTLIRCHFSPSYSTGQRYIYTGCAAGRIVIYDLLSGEIVKTLKGHRACVRDVSWHPFRPEIVSTSWDNTVGLWTYEGKHALDEIEEGVIGIEPDDGPAKKKLHLRRSSRLAEKERLRKSFGT